MASIVVVTEDGDERTPFLRDSQPENSFTAAEERSPGNSDDPKRRLVSLDVFRGLTVALMVLVDDAGKAFPSINHAPWFGVTLADFVMPFFLFGVGVSVSLVFKKVESRLAATKKAILRSIKLFLLGVILQGGYFHGRGDMTYGVDLEKIRLMGVLQRIAIGYLLASVLEIWLVNNTVVDSTVAFVKKYSLQMGAAILLALFYMVLLYGLYVPDWAFDLPDGNMIKSSPLNSNTRIVSQDNRSFAVVVVGTFPICIYVSTKDKLLAPPNIMTVPRTATLGRVFNPISLGNQPRGNLEPPCNAVGYIDRILLGEQHLYQHPVYRRTKECSVNSPDYGPLPLNSPAWCLAPFDPEGTLSSLMAAITCLIGLHCGHVLVHSEGQRQRIILWSISSLPLLICGYLLSFLGFPFSKPMYTLSYMFITAGASGILLSVIYFIVDVNCIQRPTVIFQWMGMNALIVYALAACDLFPAALQGFYWRSPENNLVDSSERLLQSLFHSEKWGTLAFVMLEILFWGIFAGFLHMKRIYMKL